MSRKSTDQLRYSAGKAKLSYPFASSRAWKLIRDSFNPANYNGESLYNEEVDSSETPNSLLTNLYEFLGRETDDLTAVFVDTMNLLQEDLQGEPPAYSESFDGFLGDNRLSLEKLCAVYEYGEKKYARGNYRKGASVTSYLDSALRHFVFGYMNGERNDVESGLPHLAHVAWNLLIAMDQPSSRDDRLPAISDPGEVYNTLNDHPDVCVSLAPTFNWVPMARREQKTR